MSVSRLLVRRGYDVTPLPSPQRLLEKLAVQQPDCVLTDVMMDETDGFNLAELIRKAHPAIGFVFMTAWPKLSDAIQALKRYGGTNYLQKPMSAEAILEAVADAVAWSRPRQQALHQISPLAMRERQVLILLAQGMSNKQIAFELKLSQKLIEYNRSSLTTKVGTGDMSAIVSLGRSLEGVI